MGDYFAAILILLSHDLYSCCYRFVYAIDHTFTDAAGACMSSGSHSFGHNAVIINLLVVIARPTFCDGVWPGYKATAGDAQSTHCTHAHGETAHTHIYMDVYCK